MRTNKTLRIASVLLIAVLMTTCVIGGTFAKYTSTVNATAESATIAKWDVKLTEADGLTKIESFDLFKTSATYEEDGETVDDHVTQGKIAPGTGGQFVFKVQNDSEVAMACVITFETTGIGEIENDLIPIEFAIDEGEFGDLTTITSDTISMGQAKEVTVKWRWALGDASEDEAALAMLDTLPQVTVAATIQATQVG